MDYSDIRYLLAKRTVDDRALNRVVLGALKDALAERGGRPRVLELGAGVGTMVSRLAEWGVLTAADYTLLDSDASSLRAAADHLRSWALDQGCTTEVREGSLALRSDEVALQMDFEANEAFRYLDDVPESERFDVVMANAVLDLMDLRPALESIWRALKPRGLFWFSINFDGETLLLPEHELDAEIMRLYHRTMDQRVRHGRPAGDSKTGRRLLTLVGETGASLLSAGSSDWVVFSGNAGYPDDEAYFLHHIVHTIDVALRGHTELRATELERWVRERHAQIEASELRYVAHQLDVFGIGPS